MAIFAIHSPPFHDGGAGLERVRAIKTTLAPWAFVFGPLWLLFKGLWLEVAIWVLLAAAVEFAIAQGVLAPGAGPALYWLGAIFLAVMGRTLQGWSLERGGRPLTELIDASDAVAAERAYLQRILPALAAPAPVPPHASYSSPKEPHVIGLFPESGR